MVTVARYDAVHREMWNRFVTDARNGVFLFHRDYLEYHSDRFTDFSLLFFDGDKLVGIMPANRDGDTLCSHGGLTFGGILSDQRMRTPVMLELFDTMREHLKAQGIAKVIYKVVPHIYHDIPAEEDLYALFRHEAKLVRRDVSSTILLRDRVGLSQRRKRSIRRARTNGLHISQSHDFPSFMAVVEEVLRTRHGVKPTHTAEEIERLARTFPDHIQLFAAHREQRMVAGVVIYESRQVAHAQYIASSNEGRQLFAMDLLLDFLINEQYAQKTYFDFGISTESRGRVLNVGLVTQKEEFGARATVYDTYEMDVR